MYLLCVLGLVKFVSSFICEVVKKVNFTRSAVRSIAYRPVAAINGATLRLKRYQNDEKKELSFTSLPQIPVKSLGSSNSDLEGGAEAPW